jgi:hypothetical protein
VLHAAAGHYAFFLLLSEEMENMLRLILKDKAFKKEAWELARSAYVPEAAIPVKTTTGATLLLEKPKEFIVGI